MLPKINPAIIFIFLYIPFTLKAQVDLSNYNYSIDEGRKWIICNHFPSAIPGNTSELIFNATYSITEPINKIEAGTSLKAHKGGQEYKIYFTNIPIVKITAEDIIQAAEKPGSAQILDTLGNKTDLNIAIKIRGASSASFPKKSYRIQNHNEFGEEEDISLFGMRNDEKWLMLAMYNEWLKLNNKVSHDLWREMHTLYYQDQEPNAHSSLRGVYVEAFVNDSYNGVYFFTENTDRKQLKLKKEKNGETRGELYKAFDVGNTGYTQLPWKSANGAKEWGGWEAKYPKNDLINWSNLYDFTNFAMNSSDNDFKQNIGEKIKLDNLSDYYIFINVIKAYDNTAKNNFIAKYKKDEPYFYIPWDLDGTLGYGASALRMTGYYDIIKLLYNNNQSSYNLNRLFDRLIKLDVDSFRHNTALRWFELRQNHLSLSNLHQKVDQEYNLLQKNNVYERDYARWEVSYKPNFKGFEEEYIYMKGWIEDRLDWLDDYFDDWVESCEAPQIIIKNERFTNGEKVTLRAEGCNAEVNWYDSPTAVNPIFTGPIMVTPRHYEDKTYYASCKIGTCESESFSSILVEANCSDHKLIIGNHSGQSIEYSTSEEIESSVSISENTNYYSGKSIILKPGFVVENGLVFKADIKGCDD